MTALARVVCVLLLVGVRARQCMIRTSMQASLTAPLVSLPAAACPLSLPTPPTRVGSQSLAHVAVDPQRSTG